jgi:GNAT superfamily N-acetyltransferase
MQIIELREVPHHLETLAGWHHSQWSYLNPDRTLAERIDGMQLHLTPDFIPTTFVAAEDKLFGSAAIIECDMDTRKELSPWLASVYVAPEFRKRGIGTKLVLRVMEKAKDNNIKTLYLYTPDRESFYARLGWSTLEKTDYHGYPVTIMNVNL